MFYNEEGPSVIAADHVYAYVLSVAKAECFKVGGMFFEGVV